jgi:hypothetical protein
MAVIVPDFGSALAIQDANNLFIQMPLGFQRVTRRNFPDVSPGYALHAVQVQKRRLATGPGIRRNFEAAKISHTVADMYRQPLALHPPNVSGLLVKRRNVHRYDLLVDTFFSAHAAT